MIRRLPWLLLVAAPAGLLHCSDDATGTTPTNTPDAATVVVPAPDGSTQPQPEAGTVVLGPEECGVETLCLDLALVTPPAEDYKIVVYWFQLDDDGPDPAPELGYEATVKAGTTRIQIPRAEVKPPTDEKVLLCDRASDDENASPCLSDPKVGYGLVFALPLTVDGGAIKQGIGRANAMFGYSAKAYPLGTAPNKAFQWDVLWPEGIQEGVRIYEGKRANGSGFDRPVPSKAGTVHTLAEKGLNLT